MTIREIQSKIKWEDFLRKVQEKTFLQSFNWGEFNKAIGNKVWRFGIYEDRGLCSVAQVIKIKAKRGTFLFVPHAPLLCSGNSKFEILNSKQTLNTLNCEAITRSEATGSKFQILNSLLEKLKDIAKGEKASFIRVASVWERNEENKEIFKKLGFRQAPLHIHPEKTWQMDVGRPKDELLMAMRKTTRYLIRQGLKNNDLRIIQSQNIKDLEIFNEIYQKTAQRHEFRPFSFDYLKKQFEASLPSNEISLFLARYKGEIVAGAIIVFWQDRAFYHHGASLQKYPKIPASYLLQWQAIGEAKKRGCKIYNFWGIADTRYKIQDTRYELKKHPWAGLTLFKQGFGGHRKEYVKTQDFILSQKYWLNFVVEKLRKVKRGY